MWLLDLVWWPYSLLTLSGVRELELSFSSILCNGKEKGVKGKRGGGFVWMYFKKGKEKDLRVIRRITYDH